MEVLVSLLIILNIIVPGVSVELEVVLLLLLSQVLLIKWLRVGLREDPLLPRPVGGLDPALVSPEVGEDGDLLPGSHGQVPGHLACEVIQHDGSVAACHDLAGIDRTD